MSYVPSASRLVVALYNLDLLSSREQHDCSFTFLQVDWRVAGLRVVWPLRKPNTERGQLTWHKSSQRNVSEHVQCLYHCRARTRHPSQGPAAESRVLYERHYAALTLFMSAKSLNCWYSRVPIGRRIAKPYHDIPSLPNGSESMTESSGNGSTLVFPSSSLCSRITCCRRL